MSLFDGQNMSISNRKIIHCSIYNKHQQSLFKFTSPSISNGFFGEATEGDFSDWVVGEVTFFWNLSLFSFFWNLSPFFSKPFFWLLDRYAEEVPSVDMLFKDPLSPEPLRNAAGLAPCGGLDPAARLHEPAPDGTLSGGGGGRSWSRLGLLEILAFSKAFSAS